MSRRKKYYLVLDTETCTLPFADSIGLNPMQRKNLGIMKPIIYDIGWIISDRQGNVIKEVSYLVHEVFFTPTLFNTAFYGNKRPLYLERLAKGDILVRLWNDIVEELIDDLLFVDIACAYNACFDFKKAIPFTEQYMKYFYKSPMVYQRWLNKQVKLALSDMESKNETYLDPFFDLRDYSFPIFDLWGGSCEKLINTLSYKKMLLESGNLSKSVHYYKSSAETVFQYVTRNIEFEEEHTALSDAYIETYILGLLLKKGKILPNIQPFPFRKLGNPIKDCRERKSFAKYRETVLALFEEYLETYEKSTDTVYYESKVKEFESLCLEWA